MSVSDAQATLLSDRILTLAGGRLTQGPQSPGGNVIEFPGTWWSSGLDRSRPSAAAVSVVLELRELVKHYRVGRG